MSKATIKDVARMAGVSIKTVSRVVNQEPNVREGTRLKVSKAIEALHYRPNLSARNLASLQSRLIALLYDDPAAYHNSSSGYIIRMQQGALKACKTANFELLIHPCNYRSAAIGEELEGLIEQTRPHGIVLAAPLSNMSTIVRTIAATGTPLARLSAGAIRSKYLSICTNDEAISAEMTCYLASLGHRRIAFITGHEYHRAVGDRFSGYLKGLADSGLKSSSRLIAAGDNSFDSGQRCARQLLSLNNRPTAIFAANDEMAAGVIRVADQMGLAIPGDLSVVGCDDDSLASQIYPALTTIRQPLAAMAEQAASALIQHRVGQQVQPPSVIAARLVIRESTGPAPNSTPRFTNSEFERRNGRSQSHHH